MACPAPGIYFPNRVFLWLLDMKNDQRFMQRSHAATVENWRSMESTAELLHHD